MVSGSLVQEISPWFVVAAKGFLEPSTQGPEYSLNREAKFSVKRVR
jgi:hypothetical protein